MEPQLSSTWAAAGVAVAGLLAVLVSRRKRRLPPGPRGWPLVGNSLQMANSKEAFYVTLQKWAKEKYGSVISVYMGPDLCVTLNSAEVAYEALITQGDDFSGRPMLKSLEVFSQGYKDIGMATFTPGWRQRRKILVNALHHYMTGSGLQDVVHQAVNMVADKMAAEPEPFDPAPYTNKLNFWIMDAICFGGGVKPWDHAELSHQADLLEKLNDDVGNGFWEDFVPLLHHWPTKKYRSFQAHMADIQAFLLRQVVGHRATFCHDDVSDLTYALLRAQAEAARDDNGEAKEAYTDTHVVQTLLDILGAAVENARVSLNWALLLLAGHPEVQQRIQGEIDEVTGGRAPVTSDRGRMPYTQAALLEVLRMGVVNPLAVPHTATKDTSVHGFHVPKDTLVMVNHWAILHDENTWPDPDKFKPERFLNEHGELRQQDGKWTPFSGGRRRCPGEGVFKPELLLIVTSLLQRYSVALPEGCGFDTFPNMALGMEHCQPQPFKITLTPR